MKVNGKAPPPPVTYDDDEDLPPPSDDDGWDAPPPFEGEKCTVTVLVVSVLELTQAQAMMIYRRLMTMACRLRLIL
jgi:hypothetical protein